MQGTPEVEVVAADVHVQSTELDLVDVNMGNSFMSRNTSTNFTVVAGANAAIIVSIYIYI